MKFVFWIAAVACCPQAIAEHESVLGILSKENEEGLRQLRLERSKSWVLQLPVDESVKARLLSTNDQELLQAALQDQSISFGPRLASTLKARAMMHELADLASDQRIEKSLLSSGIDPEKLRANAAFSTNPIQKAQEISKRLEKTNDGRMRLRLEGVLITKPELIADDKLLPGVKGQGPQPDKPVWRSGLKFAALLGVTQGTKTLGLCSGTVVAKNWVITAAHCLLDETSGGIIDPKKISVYLPFQEGNESVSSPNGFVNRDMRRVRVDAVAWIGDTTQDSFPSNEQGFSQIIFEGKDLALLKLNEIDVSSLPTPIASVKLFNGVPTSPPISAISAVGYGITDFSGVGRLGLMVGIRDSLPNGLEDGSDLLTYGPNRMSTAGGTCGGDSGGGLFAGRVDGQSAQLRLVGVISSLVGSGQNSTVDFCVTEQQSHMSLITQRNRSYVCARVPTACT